MLLIALSVLACAAQDYGAGRPTILFIGSIESIKIDVHALTRRGTKEIGLPEFVSSSCGVVEFDLSVEDSALGSVRRSVPRRISATYEMGEWCDVPISMEDLHSRYVFEIGHAGKELVMVRAERIYEIPGGVEVIAPLAAETVGRLNVTALREKLAASVRCGRRDRIADAQLRALVDAGVISAIGNVEIGDAQGIYCEMGISVDVLKTALRRADSGKL